jgi:hypothetical protein
LAHHPTVTGRFPEDLVEQLRAAERAVRAARVGLDAALSERHAAIGGLRAVGWTDERIARILGELQFGRHPTIEERLRIAAQLRQARVRKRRQRVTARHVDPPAGGGAPASGSPRSNEKEDPMAKRKKQDQQELEHGRLVRRTITEEFVDDAALAAADADPDQDDDLGEDMEGDVDVDEQPRRRRNR